MVFPSVYFIIPRAAFILVSALMMISRRSLIRTSRFQAISFSPCLYRKSVISKMDALIFFNIGYASKILPKEKRISFEMTSYNPLSSSLKCTATLKTTKSFTIPSERASERV